MPTLGALTPIFQDPTPGECHAAERTCRRRAARGAALRRRAQRSKESANVFNEELRLFEGREMAAGRHLRPPLYVEESLAELARTRSFGKMATAVGTSIRASPLCADDAALRSTAGPTN